MNPSHGQLICPKNISYYITNNYQDEILRIFLFFGVRPARDKNILLGLFGYLRIKDNISKSASLSNIYQKSTNPVKRKSK